MRKIPTVFVRDPDHRAYVLPVVDPACGWVLAGEGVATRKLDGAAFMLDARGRWWGRREVKPGKQTPPNYRLEDFDPVTGKQQGWEPVEQHPFAEYALEAARTTGLGTILRPGTYELIGPRVNGNPERALQHVLVRHGAIPLPDLTGLVYPDAVAAWTFLRDTLARLDALGVATDRHLEGVVWHHPDGRMAKLKLRDFDHGSDYDAREAVRPSA